ncbi:MAG TPA: aminopeptidase P N-terminal domain-containing protein [Nitrosospira sp.]|nr:aminopeptidase P N-terminal domain-containing protein [Nitrosospira sp.]
MVPIKSIVERRQHLALQMQKGVAILPTSPERVRNGDAYYPYRYDSYFYYLSGFTEPEAVLVIVATGDKEASRQILFCRDKDPQQEIWNGFRYGPEAAREAFGFDEAYSVSKLDEMLPKLLVDQPAVFCSFGQSPEWDLRIRGWIHGVRQHARSGVAAPGTINDIRLLLDEMRLFKSPEELQIMRQAAEISAGAHLRAMQQTRPGMNEYQVEADLLQEFRWHGAQAPAYPSIVAGGAKACVLHYIENNAKLDAGDLLLIDAGCELDGYASDITRTFPVDGKFSAAQRDLYGLVLSAQAEAIAAVRPGNSWNAPHEAALRVLAQGFIDFGLCHGTLEQVLQSEEYKRFYMHRTGHWLGLDVHDAGEYKVNGEWRKLCPGMTLTVEPGCYVRPAEDVPEHFWNIGIRIEDDVAVTDDGCEILTSAAPKTVADIEDVMGNR